MTEWVNFVRGVEAGIDRAAMGQHLSVGCSGCGRMVAALQRTAALVSVDATFEPSPHDVQRAEKILASTRPKKKSQLDRLVPRLISDSLLEPLPGGVRARRPKWRQLLYEAGDFYIDLVLYPVPNTRLVRLLGQVTNRRDPTWFPGTRPILLKSGKTTVRRAASSEFQEFQMEDEPQPGLRLEVPIVGVREPIELALERPDTGGAEAIPSDPVKQRSKKPRVKKPRRARKMSRQR